MVLAYQWHFISVTNQRHPRGSWPMHTSTGLLGMQDQNKSSNFYHPILHISNSKCKKVGTTRAPTWHNAVYHYHHGIVESLPTMTAEIIQFG